MKFLSHIQRNSIVIHPGRSRNTEFGEEVLIPMVIAQFTPGDITADELAFAERVFKGETNGRTLELDEVTPTALLGRLSSYDTDEHAEEFEQLDAEYGAPRGYRGEWQGWKAYTEERLLSRSQPGSDSRLYEAAPLTPPWPKYNDFRGSIDDLVMKVLDDGFHIPSVIEYERSSLNRPEIVEALEEAQKEFAPDTVAGDFVQA